MDEIHTEPPQDVGRPRMSRRRMAALAFVGLVLGTTLLAIGFGGVSRIGPICRVCHSMRPYAAANVESAHASVTCASCHGERGRFAIFGDGLALERRIAASLLGRSPAPLAAFDDTGCRDCHTAVLARTVRGASGVAVRHSDFLDIACVECHAGTAHALDDRLYSATRMEDCTGCHRVSYRNTEACAQCHRADWYAESSEARTIWRVTHGPQWQKTHGMGDLSRCVMCHPREYCIDCHGTVIPHPSWWRNGHGQGLSDAGRVMCEKCHDSMWCTNCHRIDMPHPSAFLRKHDTIAKQTGEGLCLRCHAVASCEQCHLTAEHPDVDGVNRRHAR